MAQSEPSDIAKGKQIAWLRRLVLALGLTMMAGITILVGLALWLFVAGERPPTWPETLAIPAGETVQAVTRATSWIAVVTKDSTGAETIHILSPDGGERRQSVAIKPGDG